MSSQPPPIQQQRSQFMAQLPAEVRASLFLEETPITWGAGFVARGSVTTRRPPPAVQQRRSLRPWSASAYLPGSWSSLLLWSACVIVRGGRVTERTSNSRSHTSWACGSDAGFGLAPPPASPLWPPKSPRQAPPAVYRSVMQPPQRTMGDVIASYVPRSPPFQTSCCVSLCSHSLIGRSLAALG